MSYLHKYQELHQAFRKCREILTLTPIDPVYLKQIIGQLQQQSQQNWDCLEQTIAQPVEAFQVEINKQLRLLGVDCLFLQTAQQPEKIEQRLAQIQTRLDLLERYCVGILEKMDRPENINLAENIDAPN